jgi:hypothetical protein
MAGEFSRHKVKFVVEGVGEATGELVRFLAPRTVEALIRAVPLEGRVATWKEEVYFEVNVKVGPEKVKSRVERETIAYWPLGSAVCVFYGDSQPYSPVNVIGRITEGLDIFRNAKQGSKVTLDRL